MVVVRIGISISDGFYVRFVNLQSVKVHLISSHHKTSHKIAKWFKKYPFYVVLHACTSNECVTPFLAPSTAIMVVDQAFVPKSMLAINLTELHPTIPRHIRKFPFQALTITKMTSLLSLNRKSIY